MTYFIGQMRGKVSEPFVITSIYLENYIWVVWCMFLDVGLRTKDACVLKGISPCAQIIPTNLDLIFNIIGVGLGGGVRRMRNYMTIYCQRESPLSQRKIYYVNELWKILQTQLGGGHCLTSIMCSATYKKVGPSFKWTFNSPPTLTPKP